MTRLSRRDCAGARALASMALDFELSEFDRRALAAHTRTCPDCAAFQGQARKVTEFVRASEPERPAVPLWQRPRRRARRFGRVVAVAGTLAAASALGAYMAGPRGGDAHVKTPAPIFVAERPGLAREFRAIHSLPQPFHQAGRRWPRTQFLT